MSDTSSGPSRREAPRGLGLRLFAPGVEPAFRRRRLVFLAIYLAAVLGAVTPALPGVWSGRLGVLGIPVSFQWILLLLTVVFVALVWLYRSEPEEARIVTHPSLHATQDRED